MKEIAENAAAAAAHCALHLDCFKTFPHHDIPPGSHCTLCYSHQPPTHLCPAAEVRETPLSPFFDPFQKEGKSYSRAKDIFLHWCHAHFVFSINESWYKEDIKPNITWIHISWYWSPGLCCVEYQWRFLFLLQDVLPASWGNISLALIKIEEKMIQCWPDL